MTEIQSLERGLKILDLLGMSQEGTSITELAEILGVDKESIVFQAALTAQKACHKITTSQ